jgi:hypothetical protein
MAQSLEVDLIGKSISQRFTDTDKGVVGQWEHNPVCAVVSITSGPGDIVGFASRDAVTNQRRHKFKYDDMLRIIIEFQGAGQSKMDFNIQDVTNQPGWTPDPAGLAQALVDINAWVATCSDGSGGPGSGATEATLQALLTATQAHQDFEVKLVRDTGDGDKTLCEVMEYDEGTDTYTYTYKDVGGAVVVPVGPLEYLDPEAVLNLLLAEMQAITGTDGVAHGASQQGQRILGTDGTNDQQISTDATGAVNVVLSGITGLATETTLALVNSNVQLGNITLNSLLTEFNNEDFATQTTLAALLTAFNAEDFASQTTLAALLTAFNAEDFATQTTSAAILAAIQATNTTLATTNSILQDIDDNTDGLEAIATNALTELQAINLNTDTLEALITAGNVDLAAIEAELLAQGTQLGTIITQLIAANTALGTINTSVITADTNNVTELQNIQTQLTTALASLVAIDGNTAPLEASLTAIEALITAGNIDLASLEATALLIQTNTLNTVTELQTANATLTLLNGQFAGTPSIVRVDISGNGAYVVPASTYNSVQLIVVSSTVSDGTIIYPAGTFEETVPIKGATHPGVTFNATGATAYVKLMTN